MSAVTQGPAAAGALTGLARALVQQGKLRPDRAENFARKAAQSNTQFIDELTNSADVTGLTASGVAKFAAETFGHPMLDLAAVDLEQLPRDIIDKKLVATQRVLALRKRGNRLAIAVSDPTNFRGARSGQVPDPIGARCHRRRARQTAATGRVAGAVGQPEARGHGRQRRCQLRRPAGREPGTGRCRRSRAGRDR